MKMYRAVQDYDGSSTGKCIRLNVGDLVSGVRSLDDSWYLGHNDASDQTGAFPAYCVEMVSENEYTSHEGKATRSEKTTQLHSDGRSQGVRFQDVKLEQSMSISGDSVMSWGESFEHSLEKSTDSTKKSKPFQPSPLTGSQRSEGIYHKIEESLPESVRIHTDALLHSGRGQNMKIKAIFGVIAGIIIGLLLFAILVKSFSYTPLQAAIIMLVSTVIFCICLALSSLCRCVMALVLPNFFTGKGRAVFLSIIFGVMLAGPIENITTNARESGHSMACVTDLIGRQVRALQGQMEVPVANMAAYVKRQKQELDDVVKGIDTSLSHVRYAMNEIKRTTATASTVMNNIYDKCRQPITTVVNECRSACSKLPFISGSCLSQCSSLNDVGKLCDPLKTGETYLSQADKQTRASLDDVLQFFQADVNIKYEAKGEANSSKTANSIENEVKADIDSKAIGFETFFVILKKLLSFSLLLLFIQSFWYLRNYLSKDGYDNVYVTKQFRELDLQKSQAGQVPLLPLKPKEKGDYVDTSSVKMNAFELEYSRLGIAQVFMHFLVYVVVLLFDYSLYYVLELVRKYGSLDLDIQTHGQFTVDVKGTGPIAEFYRVLMKDVNLQESFIANLHVAGCLPKPSRPPTATAPVILSLYVAALLFCLLRGYGMRLRRKIAAYYYPEQERARLEFLHKTIRHRRAGFLRFLRQQVKSSHKEKVVKNELRLSTWAASKCPGIMKCMPRQEKRECTSCELKESNFHKVTLTNCDGVKNGAPCPAMYCDECRTALGGSCPLCVGDDVRLRD